MNRRNTFIVSASLIVFVFLVALVIIVLWASGLFSSSPEDQPDTFEVLKSKHWTRGVRTRVSGGGLVEYGDSKCTLDASKKNASVAVFYDKRLWHPTVVDVDVDPRDDGGTFDVAFMLDANGEDSEALEAMFPGSEIVDGSRSSDFRKRAVGEYISLGAGKATFSTLRDSKASQHGSVKASETDRRFALRVETLDGGGYMVSVNGSRIYTFPGGGELTAERAAWTGFLALRAEGARYRIRGLTVSRNPFSPSHGPAELWDLPSDLVKANGNPYGAVGFAEGTYGGYGASSRVYRVEDEEELVAALSGSTGPRIVVLEDDIVMKSKISIEKENENVTLESSPGKRRKISFDFSPEGTRGCFRINAPNVVFRDFDLGLQRQDDGTYGSEGGHDWIRLAWKDNARPGLRTITVHHVLLKRLRFFYPRKFYGEEISDEFVQINSLCTHITLQECYFENPYQVMDVSCGLRRGEYSAGADAGDVEAYRDITNAQSVTLAGCYFAGEDKLTRGNGRTPKALTGKLHVLNCGFKNLNLGAEIKGYASALYEGCFFEDCRRPAISVPITFNTDGKRIGRIHGDPKKNWVRGVDRDAWGREGLHTHTLDWYPPYNYTLMDPSKSSDREAVEDLGDLLDDTED